MVVLSGGTALTEGAILHDAAEGNRSRCEKETRYLAMDSDTEIKSASESFYKETDSAGADCDITEHLWRFGPEALPTVHLKCDVDVTAAAAATVAAAEAQKSYATQSLWGAASGIHIERLHQDTRQ